LDNSTSSSSSSSSSVRLSQQQIDRSIYQPPTKALLSSAFLKTPVCFFFP
jgi:hypothetical protein